MSADVTFLDNASGKYLQIFEYTQYMEYQVLLNTYDQNCTYMIRVHWSHIAHFTAWPQQNSKHSVFHHLHWLGHFVKCLQLELKVLAVWLTLPQWSKKNRPAQWRELDSAPHDPLLWCPDLGQPHQKPAACLLFSLLKHNSPGSINSNSLFSKALQVTLHYWA